MAEAQRIDKARAARARAALSRLGVTQTQLARALGVSVKLVNEVARGRLIGERGKTHKVAVALGLKDGEILPEQTSTEELIARLQRAAKEVAV
ncbi:MAG: helix-turn-helix domain-containing protein [Thermomonas hydrothermalis]|uniref:helix-turn-helix domain-containing protein n=1 Tax=Thermomonas hydrothermalis TaxID=213588 RepID=UPI0023548CDB|nr:helix-turn-helix domain-containing protein [Thermomonas hydrothermalis]MCL6619463.1 helix-turn-helix domain-containing protein [Thermomonas hydrothermalis]